MKDLTITAIIKVYQYDELNETDRSLMKTAMEATARSYAPYSHFSVGAAALNTEMIITLACQLAVSGSAFKQSLCQSDTCGNFVKLHLLHSQVTILIYIFYITCIPSLCLYSYGKEDNGS